MLRERMNWKRVIVAAMGLLGLGTMLTEPAAAATACQNTGNFERWMDGFKQEAATQGISRQAIASALDGITFDPGVVRRDRGQGVFQQGFIQFAERMTARGRYDNGLRQL